MMGLIGNLAGLLAGGSRYVPPPPPPTPQSGPDSTRSTSAAPPVADGPSNASAAASTAAAPAVDPSAPPAVQPPRPAPTAAAQSVPRQGTPADSSPIRADISPASRPSDEDAARTFAVAAQARERLDDLVMGLADAAAGQPALPVVRAGKPEQPLGGAGINATLPTLRGENAAGTALDKVA